MPLRSFPRQSPGETIQLITSLQNLYNWGVPRDICVPHVVTFLVWYIEDAVAWCVDILICSVEVI